MSNFHKPVRRPSDVIELMGGSGDPAELSALAHDTATALLHRVREASDPAIVDRVIAYADVHGIDDVAELWADASADSLPGALWRIYLLRHSVAGNPESAGLRFRRGLDVDVVGHAMVGAGAAPTPADVTELATVILKGAFVGDFAAALERSAAFARVMAVGANDLATGEADDVRREQEAELAASFGHLADELTHAAPLWRGGHLR